MPKTVSIGATREAAGESTGEAVRESTEEARGLEVLLVEWKVGEPSSLSCRSGPMEDPLAYDVAYDEDLW